MNQPKAAKARTSVPPVAGQKLQPAHPEQDMGRTIRETVESIVIAFVLAFLFRTFEAEAFVIPTGSMAPTLQGRHKDLLCQNCGYRVRTSASEVDRIAEDGRFSSEQARRNAIANAEVVAVTCPLCRFRTSVDPETAAGEEHPTYNGDRILVAKFPFDFIEPKRWDIVVFKFPNDAKTNYIKRLVGLPNETIKLFHGDIFTKPDGTPDFLIERKPPEKQLAMAQMVYDNNYIVPKMQEKGWPARWYPASSSAASTEWKSDEEGKAFGLKASGGGQSWLRYRHLPPTQTDWSELRQGNIPADDEPLPQLITDFYAYNAGVVRDRDKPPPSPGINWVGDLMLSADFEIRSDKGHLLLDLVEGGVHFRATIDVASGIAALSIDGLSDFHPTATTSVEGPGSYAITFANFDDQLTLWVNGSVVMFDKPTSYTGLNNDQPRSTPEDPGDLAPVGVGGEGGLEVKVSALQVKRDIYYIADKYGSREAGGLSEYETGTRVPYMTPDELAAFFSNPKAWREPGPNGRNAFELRRELQFPLYEDQFFVLGDNSPASADSRLWTGQHHVGREMMIGKALFIYWPHGLYHIPGTGIPFPLGMFPNFKDMGFVR